MPSVVSESPSGSSLDGQRQIELLRAELAEQAAANAQLRAAIGVRDAALEAAASRERILNERLSMLATKQERIRLELQTVRRPETPDRLARLAHEIVSPIQNVDDSVHFLRSAFDDLSVLFHGYREALNSLRSTQTPAAALWADLHDMEITCDFEFLAQEVPKAFERTLAAAERVAAIVRAIRTAAPDDSEHGRAGADPVQTNAVAFGAGGAVASAGGPSRRADFAELAPAACNVGPLEQVFLDLIVSAAQAIQDAGGDVTSRRIGVTARQAGPCIEVVVTVPIAK